MIELQTKKEVKKEVAKEVRSKPEKRVVMKNPERPGFQVGSQQCISIGLSNNKAVFETVKGGVNEVVGTEARLQWAEVRK